MLSNDVNLSMDSYILYIMYMEGYGMKTTEMIEILEHCLEVFGDCELVCLDSLGSADAIEIVEFIGSDKVLLMADTFYDRTKLKLYRSTEHNKNEGD